MAKLPADLKNIELVVYQISEVKNLLGNMDTKLDAYKDSNDKRVQALENFRAAQEAKALAGEPRLDVQKIFLTAFGILSALVAIALWIAQHPVGR